jgi:hypothetical protein
MPRRVLLLALPLVLSVACQPRQARPTPPPSFAGKPIATVSTGDVLAYAQTLQFDSTTPGADTLTVQTPTGDTIHLRGAPEIGAAAIADSDLASGRIIARIQSTAPFSALGLAAGTNYFFVQGKGDRAIGAMIPADSLARRFVRPLLLRDHLSGTTPTARFLDITHEGVRIFIFNGRCGSYCCGFASDFVADQMPVVDSAIKEMHQRIAGGHQ